MKTITIAPPGYRKPLGMASLADVERSDDVIAAKKYCSTQVKNITASFHGICVVWYLANKQANPRFDTFPTGRKEIYTIDQISDVLNKYIQLAQANKIPEYDVAKKTTEQVIRGLVSTYPNHSEAFYRVVMHNLRIAVENKGALRAIQYPVEAKALIEQGSPELFKEIDKYAEDITGAQDANSLVDTLKTAGLVLGGILALTLIVPLFRK